MKPELIKCPIDGTNIIFEIFDDLFDDGEYLNHGEELLGFVGKKPTLVRYKDNHIYVDGNHDLLAKRLREVLDLNDKEQPDEEYEHFLVVGSSQIGIYYKPKQ